MKETNPELVERLVNYQLKAKDVLAAVFLPQKCYVEQLTITSRELTILVKENQQVYHNIMFRIRECITELQEMGLNPDDYFINLDYSLRVV